MHLYKVIQRDSCAPYLDAFNAIPFKTIIQYHSQDIDTNTIKTLNIFFVTTRIPPTNIL